MTIDKRVLNDKLAKFADFHYQTMEFDCFIDEHGYSHDLFTDSLDACFKHLVPKVMDNHVFLDFETRITIVPGRSEAVISHHCEIWSGRGQTFSAVSETPALALCLAVEKLVDAKVTA